MIFKKGKKTVRLTKEQLESSVIAAMYLLSDGLEWRLGSQKEDEPGNPLVMSSPEEIAEAVINYVFWKPLPGSEDSSSSTASS